jgi:hypothetical protein
LPSGCFAGGIPAKVIKYNEYSNRIAEWAPVECDDLPVDRQILAGDTIFNITRRTIKGKVTEESERVKDRLRRNGIRFKYYAKDGEYGPWKES